MTHGKSIENGSVFLSSEYLTALHCQIVESLEKTQG